MEKKGFTEIKKARIEAIKDIKKIFLNFENKVFLPILSKKKSCKFFVSWGDKEVVTMATNDTNLKAKL